MVFPSLVASLALYWTLKLSTKRPRPFVAIPEFKALVPPLDKYSLSAMRLSTLLAIEL